MGTNRVGTNEERQQHGQDYHADFALDWALKDLDLAASEAGPDVVPVAVAIAERWRGLVDAGSSGLDVKPAGQGLGPVAPEAPGRQSTDGGTADQASLVGGPEVG